MRESEQPALSRLLRSVRLHLWAIHASSPLLLASWIAATLGAGIGLWHLLIGGLSVEVLILATLGVLGLGLAFSLARRPSIGRAARVADVWLDGSGLMTAAVDQLERPLEQRAAVSGLIVARAESFAEDWTGQLGRVLPPAGMWRIYPPLAVVALAAVMHVLPGAAPTPLSQGSLDAGGMVGEDPMTRGRMISDLDDRRMSEFDSKREHSSAPRPGANEFDDLENAEPIPNDGSGSKEGRMGDGLAAQAAGGAAPGSAVARSRHERSLPEAAPLPSEEFEIRRESGSRGQSVAPLGTAELFAAASRTLASVPPAQRVESRARPHLSPQQRAYVDGFLRAVGDQQ